MCQPNNQSPSPRAFWSNFAGPRPWTEKIALFFKNSWRKISHFQSCCGRPGEPGC
jgi:hypothetical protein